MATKPGVCWQCKTPVEITVSTITGLGGMTVTCGYHCGNCDCTAEWSDERFQGDDHE